MDLGAAGLSRQPFPSHGAPLAVVSYRSEQEAIQVLQATCEHPRGISLLQGPTLSGKSTLINTFMGCLTPQCSVALLNCQGLSILNLLISMLREFGYDIEAGSVNEALGLVRVFALQQAASNKAPMVVIENAHELRPEALSVLCELAELRVRSGSALKMVLVSDRSLKSITYAPAMDAISKRLLHDFHLGPMTQDETTHYLRTKLRAAGSEIPECIFPDKVCQELYRASAGWPGILDRIALLALARAQCLPVAPGDVERPILPPATLSEAEQDNTQNEGIIPPQPPRLVVSNNGTVMHDLIVDKPRLLIGRSEHNDISISSRFISRHHAMFVRHGATTFLMDLNSTNGTFINSARISNHVLIHEDVITLGHHHIKFYDPYATSRGPLDSAELNDTGIMKTLEDMRKLLARENTELMSTTSENLPTIGT